MQDLGLIIAIVGTGVALVGVVLAMMFWVRQEANSLRGEAKEDRRDFLHMIGEFKDTIHEIHLENKDFHYRLLEIEKGRK
mgnify:CR=1 FL=1